MLSRRTKINITLLFLVAILAVVLLLLPGRHARIDPLPPLTWLDAEAIRLIGIVNRDGQSIQMQRSTQGWAITAPYSAQANQTRIEGLLKIVSTPSYLKIPASDQDLSLFGLTSPVASLQLNDTLLQFGTTEPVHYRRYVLVGDTVGLIDDGFYHHLLAGPEDFLLKERTTDMDGGAD